MYHKENWYALAIAIIADKTSDVALRMMGLTECITRFKVQNRKPKGYYRKIADKAYELYSGGTKQTDIARQYDVSLTVIKNALMYYKGERD